MFFASHFKVVQIELPLDAPLSCDVLRVKDFLTNLCWLLILYRLHHSILVEDTRQLYKAIETLLATNHKVIMLSDLNYRGIEWLKSDGPVALHSISYVFLELCAF